MKKSVIMIGGRSATGKSASLRHLKDPEKKLFLNFESKDLPFAHNFVEQKVTDPYTLHTISNKLIEIGNTDKYDTLIIDSITACMALFSTRYIGKNCENKMGAWGDYGSFYDHWMKELLPKIPQNIIVLAHVDYYEEPGTLDGYFQAVVQGRLQKIGLEADFAMVAAAQVVSIDKLKEFDNPNLVITEEEEIEGFKHVLQTRKTLDTKDTKIRSPLGMWEKNETYIDSDAQIVLDRYRDTYDK